MAATDGLPETWGLGSNGTENQHKHELKFALLVICCGLANFDWRNEFIAPLFGWSRPFLVLAETVS